jgi:hypothetical protein
MPDYFGKTTSLIKNIWNTFLIQIFLEQLLLKKEKSSTDDSSFIDSLKDYKNTIIHWRSRRYRTF